MKRQLDFASAFGGAPGPAGRSAEAHQGRLGRASKRLLAVCGGLLTTALLAVLFGAQLQAEQAGRQLDAATRFVDWALSPAPSRPRACHRPLISRRADRPAVGAHRFVALVETRGLGWPGAPADVVLGPGGCTLRRPELAAAQAARGLLRNARWPLDLPVGRWRSLGEPAALPLCMSAEGTELAVAARGLRRVGAHVSGQLSLRLADFTTADELCQLTVPVELDLSADEAATVARELPTRLAAEVDAALTELTSRPQ